MSECAYRSVVVTVSVRVCGRARVFVVGVVWCEGIAREIKFVGLLVLFASPVRFCKWPLYESNKAKITYFGAT